jgi:hypothetical protein
MTVLRAEHLNTRISPLARGRQQAPWYVHTPRTEGQTERGKALASVGGFGGGGTTIALDRYSDGGRTTIRWDRTMRAENVSGVYGLPNAGLADIMHALGVERVRFTRFGEASLSLTAVWDLNRNFGRDAFNLNSAASWRFFPGQ